MLKKKPRKIKMVLKNQTCREGSETSQRIISPPHLKYCIVLNARRQSKTVINRKRDNHMSSHKITRKKETEETRKSYIINK